MQKRLPNRLFYALADLKDCWQISRTELKQWLTNGDLKAQVWLPLMSAYKIKLVMDGAAMKQAPKLCHWEGYISLSRHSCMRLFKSGEIRVREFNCSENQDRYCLPETADDIIISIDDLVILADERQRFEDDHDMTGHCTYLRPVTDNGCEGSGNIYTDPDFKIVRVEGAEHRLGDIQANILRQLYESAKDGRPWQNGKKLLQQAGSQSYNLSNIFKHKPIWKKLVLSDGRGSYRVHPSLDDSSNSR